MQIYFIRRSVAALSSGPAMFSKIFADRLRQRLRDLELTQQKLADSTFVSRQTVTRWLSGAVPNAHRLVRLARFLMISPEWLLGGASKGRAQGQKEPESGIQTLLRNIARDRAERHEINATCYAEYLRGADELATPYARLMEHYQALLEQAEEVARVARKRVQELGNEFDHRMETAIREALGKTRAAKKKGLITSVYQLEVDHVKPAITLPDLLLRVHRLTEARGAKKQLAAEIRVTPQQLSDWLSEDYSPSGDVTLRLLAWVQAREANPKEKGSEGAPTPSEPKARKLRKSKTK